MFAGELVVGRFFRFAHEKGQCRVVYRAVWTTVTSVRDKTVCCLIWETRGRTFSRLIVHEKVSVRVWAISRGNVLGGKAPHRVAQRFKRFLNRGEFFGVAAFIGVVFPRFFAPRFFYFLAGGVELDPKHLVQLGSGQVVNA